MPSKRPSSVFLSYDHDDLDTVKEIYSGLKKRGLDVWFDRVELKPGSWKTQIEKAIPKCRYFVICMSNAALRKTGEDSPGFQDEELQLAYEIARIQPEEDFTIVPVRLEDCGRGDMRTIAFQQYDLFEDFDNSLDRLAVTLGGDSLNDQSLNEYRTENHIIYETLKGKADTLFYAGHKDKALEIYKSIELITEKPTRKISHFERPKIKCFISYAHAYREYFEIFHEDFKSFTHNLSIGKIETWTDEKIPLGDDWHQCIQAEVDSCNIAILLVSDRFMSSQYIKQEEVKKLIERKSDKKCLVIPVYFNVCRFYDWPELEKHQLFKPKGSKYGRADKEKHNTFCYAHLIEFVVVKGETVVIQSPERLEYMDDFVIEMLNAYEKFFTA